MRMIAVVASLFIGVTAAWASSITTSSLVDEMVDLQRLTRFPSPAYKTLQFSSHDRNSARPGEEKWFSNSDGSGVEAVLKEPVGETTGEYLLCDMAGPGAIVRMWTAEISGTIRVYLDESKSPLYDGPANQFLLRPYDTFLPGSGLTADDLDGTFYQRVASYAPIPFAKHCRIVWSGNQKDVHFHEVQARIYDSGAEVVTFTPGDMKANADRIRRISSVLKDPDAHWSTLPKAEMSKIDVNPEPGRMSDGPRLEGNGAIQQITIKVDANDVNLALRQTILRIQFDGHPWGQVEAPVGDFFGAGPGINPFASLPFTVTPGGTMTCRYLMPYAKSARIIFDNRGTQPVHITGSVATTPYTWDDETSMHFRARWRIDHGLVSSNQMNQGVQDLPFVLARGKGLYVGTAIMVLNPNVIPTSWGNWWGEGDEKIYVDDDVFPSIYGTGSEDYFNYSWSAFDIFGYPYCGQPRNDGPANRGFIVNQRWHVLDPLPFSKSMAFYMELASHERTPGVAYGRICYLYGRPEMVDDHVAITTEDLREPVLPATWEPESRFGAKDIVFQACEKIVSDSSGMGFETDGLWQGGRVMIWTPKREGETLDIPFRLEADGDYPILLTCMLKPGAGALRATLNGAEIEFDGKETLDLHIDHGLMSRMLGAHVKGLKAGNQVLTLAATQAGKPIGLDFFGTRGLK